MKYFFVWLFACITVRVKVLGEKKLNFIQALVSNGALLAYRLTLSDAHIQPITVSCLSLTVFIMNIVCFEVLKTT